MTLQPVRWNDGTWHLADESLAATLCGRTPPADAETDPEADVGCSTCVKAADRTGTTPENSDGWTTELIGNPPRDLAELFDEAGSDDEHEHGELVGYVISQIRPHDDEVRIVGLAGPEVDYPQVHRFSRTFRSASTGSLVSRVYDCGHRA